MSQGRFSQATFGRRGTAGQAGRTSPNGRPQAFRPAEFSAGGPQTAVDVEEEETAAAMPRTAGEHPLWSYFKACVAALGTAILLSSFFIDSNAPAPFTSRIFVNFVSGIVMITYAPLLLIPIRILADVFRLACVPRGVSDILIGGLVGSLMLLPAITEGKAPEPMTICFIIGGLIGGFVFWRARGYPGLTTQHHKTADQFGSVLDRARRQL
jgi:hypothetical protein